MKTKVLIIGERKSGKTSLVRNFKGEAFDVEDYEENDGVSPSVIALKDGENDVEFRVYDVHGTELKSTYTSDTGVILLAFNPNDRSTFANLQSLMNNKLIDKATPIILVSTHAETEKAEDAVTDEEISAFIAENNKDDKVRIYAHEKIDSKSGLNVQELFSKLPIAIKDPNALRPAVAAIPAIDSRITVLDTFKQDCETYSKRKKLPKSFMEGVNAYHAKATAIIDDTSVTKEVQDSQLKLSFLEIFKKNCEVIAKHEKLAKGYMDAVNAYCTKAKEIINDPSKDEPTKNAELRTEAYKTLNQHRNATWYKYLYDAFLFVTKRFSSTKTELAARQAKYGTMWRHDAPTDRVVVVLKGLNLPLSSPKA